MNGETNFVWWDFSSSKHRKKSIWMAKDVHNALKDWEYFFDPDFWAFFEVWIQLRSKFDQVLQVLLQQRRAYLIYMDEESNVDYKTSSCKVTCLIQISCCFGYDISLQMPNKASSIVPLTGWLTPDLLRLRKAKLLRGMCCCACQFQWTNMN